jgi:hypothetical protein
MKILNDIALQLDLNMHLNWNLVQLDPNWIELKRNEMQIGGECIENIFLNMVLQRVFF